MTQSEIRGETEPLLRAEHQARTGKFDTTTEMKTQQQRVVFTVLAIVTIIAGVGGFLEFAPQVKIFEDIVCDEYYKHASVSGDVGFDLRCKVDPVVKEVAFIQGWLGTLWELPGVILALPYGIMSDRIGRRPVLLICFAGVILQLAVTRVIVWWPSHFPLRLVLITPIFQLIGGGNRVLTSTAFTMLADSFSTESRSNMFFQLFALSVFIECAAPVIAALLTERTGDWTPYMIAFGIQIVAFGLCFLMPETLDRSAKADELDDGLTAELPDGAVLLPAGTRKSLSHRVLRFRENITEASGFLWDSKSVALLIVVLACAGFGKQSLFQILLIYASKRFGWSIAQASYLFSLRAFIYFLVLLVILPALSYQIVRRFKVSSPYFDLNATRSSAVVISIGFLIVGLSARIPLLLIGLVIVALGSVIDLTARTVATSLVLPTQIGTLYALITVVESLARCIANPALAAAFTLGLQLGGQWQGLPYLITAVLFGISAGLCAFVQVPNKYVESDAVNDHID